MGHPPEAHGKPNMPTEDAREPSHFTDKLQDLTTLHGGQPTSSENGHRPLESALEQSQVEPRIPRRLLPQPIETVSRSSNAQQAVLSGANQPALSKPETHSKDPSEHKPTRRFLPEPIETSKTSKRRSYSTSEVDERNPTSYEQPSTAPRRFKPDLIQTETRSVRKGEPVPFPKRHNAVGSQAPHTIISPDTASWSDINPHVHTYLPSESPFSSSNLLRRHQARRHSFRVPDLPSIPSDSSEDSDDSRPHSTCTSPPGPSDKVTRDLCTSKPLRENPNGEVSKFLLSLAAQSAQIQLKEQALAAFPNEQVYEPVDHFAVEEDSGDSGDCLMSNYNHVKSRRQSSADLSWELEYMRHHKEEAEMRIRAMAASAKRKSSSQLNKNGRSPPMLGKDLVLPRCASPEGTICDHFSLDATSRAVHDLCTGCGDLWYASPPRDGGKGSGLWMGTCCKDEGQGREGHGLFPGIVTPMPRIDESGVSMGLSPSPSHTHLNHLATSPRNHSPWKPASPNLQKVIESEFHDGFVTQIYNYLSLGYPCLARYYDYELSKISGIPVEALRRDDLKTDAKGYVVAPDKDDIANACARWKALRLYIREWARQEPGMAEEDPNPDGWGMPERKGSWAI